MATGWLWPVNVWLLREPWYRKLSLATSDLEDDPQLTANASGSGSGRVIYSCFIIRCDIKHRQVMIRQHRGWYIVYHSLHYSEQRPWAKKKTPKKMSRKKQLWRQKKRKQQRKLNRIPKRALAVKFRYRDDKPRTEKPGQKNLGRKPKVENAGDRSNVALR